ncbi:LysR family transcriptional regulator [Levilactobacillus brevis]|uniref:LysR family transcriptional regulator n=1 Tax=Levilactobacillus brevis TaxID=1580 RepID=UPI001BADCBAA|nr:LysR family transcriptional regulator [Levilactobacillus brevis]MBS1005415.1 LysR family transcriptional regulator [Levilactobacillus brevis]MBS1012611.1 LysR family transcriptional regulator [Levilactobacillus brevis]
MNLNQLRYFECVGRLENYTRAARELHVSQPSLTTAIHKLEAELKLTLFVKQGRHIVLTSTGQQLLLVVQQSLQTLDDGVAQVIATNSQQPIKLRVGCIPTVIGTFLPQVLHEFEQAHPQQVTFELHSVTTEQVQSGLAAKTFDLGIAAADTREAGMHYQPLLKQPFIVIVAPTHPLANRRQLDLADLTDYPVLTYSPELLIGKKVQRTLQRQGVASQLKLRAAYPDELSIAGMVQSSLAVGLVADTLYLAAFDLVKIPVTVPEDLRVIYAMYRAANPQHAALQQLFQLFNSRTTTEDASN